MNRKRTGAKTVYVTPAKGLSSPLKDDARLASPTPRAEIANVIIKILDFEKVRLLGHPLISPILLTGSPWLKM